MFEFIKGKNIYLDNAATTPIRKEVNSAMRPFFTHKYGNAGSIHRFGVEAKRMLEKARKEVASAMNARAQDIIFTNGGTSGNNISILGVLKALYSNGMSYKDMHIVLTNIEHSSDRKSVV